MNILRKHGVLLVILIAFGAVSALFFFKKVSFDDAELHQDVRGMWALDDVPSLFGEYVVTGEAVYYHPAVYDEPAATATLIAETDPETFKALQGDFAKDASRIYFAGKVVDGAHPASFEIILSRPSNGISPAFSKDADSVFVNATKIQEADPSSFQILDNEDYQLDQRFVYYKGVRLHEATPTTFHVWNGTPYAANHVYAYMSGELIQGADASTFEALTNYESYSLWAKDSHAVYWKGHAIPGADPSTFELYWDAGLDYGKDTERVYYLGNILDGADPEIFQPLE